MAGTPRQRSDGAPAGAFVDDYLPYLLARASHLISRQFHERLRPHGLPVAKWRVLATLSDGDGLTIGELARIVLFKQPTLTKTIDRMQVDGLVERRTSGGDRRKVQVFITPRGRQLVTALLAEAKAHEAQVTAAYSDQEMATLKRVLRTLISRLEES
jgi:DNA-binding MarR family transcriptional regulator